MMLTLLGGQSVRLALAVLVCVTMSVGLGACKPRGSQLSGVDQLAVGRYRYVIDEKHGMGRVFAEVYNGGKQTVREVEARAYLRSRSGENRGENATVLKDIMPGETRAFSVTIVAHGRAQDVVIEFHPVGQQPASEETPAASTKTTK